MDRKSCDHEWRIMGGHALGAGLVSTRLAVCEKCDMVVVRTGDGKRLIDWTETIPVDFKGEIDGL